MGVDGRSYNLLKSFAGSSSRTHCNKHGHLKIVAGRLLSFWAGLLSGAMSVAGKVTAAFVVERRYLCTKYQFTSMRLWKKKLGRQ